MTADAVVSILEAELESGGVLVATLEHQRVALIERDLTRLDELTGQLQGQFAHFSLLLRTRVRSMETTGALSDRGAALLREAQRLEARVAGLAQLNNELLADRLACVNTVLAALLPEATGGYSSTGETRPSGNTLARSA
jgi:hypothetical protein